jgi:isopenicillin-N epimerase
MMLDPSVTNLNTGSFGPSPKPVFERVTELRRMQAAEPMDFILRQTPPLLWNARTRLASFVGADPTRLIFTQNVSSAVNMVASGLKLEPGGEILTSDREYGAMHWCMERAAERQGLTLKTFPLPLMPKSPDEIIDAVAAAITPKTKLLFFSHVYAATGMIVPAKELCDLARQRGIISVVDGAHAPAVIPLQVDDLDCDFYAGNGHKWLLAPIGTGFLVLGKNSLNRLQPMHVSWGYISDGTKKPDDQDEFGSTPRIRRLEMEGTRELCPWLTVPEATDFQAKWGHIEIRARQHELSSYVRNRCHGIPGLRLVTPTDQCMHGPMTAFWVPTELAADEVRRRLWEARIEIPVTDWPDGRIIRLSTHFYTTEEEVDRFVEAAPMLFSDASAKRC